jgi:hypothetical protein
MPFLRRRGNTPSESNTKHEDLPAADDTGLDATSMPQPSNLADDADADAATAASNDYQSRASLASRPETPSVQEQNDRRKRFSVLRFRNASDPQLSLRVKQQAEKPPPVPRRALGYTRLSHPTSMLTFLQPPRLSRRHRPANLPVLGRNPPA